MGAATYFFDLINLESQQKCWHQHFSEKRRKRYISSKISLEFVFTTENETPLERFSNYMANGNRKTISGMILMTKSLL